MATVFVVQGVQATVNAFTAIENAQRRLDEAQSKMAANKDPKKAGGLAASVDEAKIRLEQLQERASHFTTAAIVAGFRQVVEVIKDAIDEYEKYTNMVMNLRDLTGASGPEAGQAAAQFRVTGINAVQIQRDLLRMSRDTLTPHGQAAFRELGIDPKTTKNGLQLFDEVMEKLSHFQNGLHKTALMQQIFGVRGVDALLPYSRLLPEQIERMKGLGTVTEESLAKSQRFQFEAALLNETFQQKLLFPLAAQLMDALMPALPVLTELVTQMGALAEETDIFSIIALGAEDLALVLKDITSFLKLIREFTSGDNKNVISTYVGTMMNPISALLDIIHPDRHKNSAETAHTNAMNQHAAALNEHADNLSRMNHGGVPEGLNQWDRQQIARQRALGAIG